MKSYSERLKDPRWIKRTAEMKAKADYRCKECGQSFEESGDRLETHHVLYVRGLQPWEYPDELLRVVCSVCHVDRQAEDEAAHLAFAKFLAKMNWQEVRAFTKFLETLSDPPNDWRKMVF